MYAIKTEDEKQHRKAKGIPNMKVGKEIEFKAYKSTLDDNGREIIKSAAVRSHKHEIHAINQKKTSPSKFDDKRYCLSNVESLPYGHCSIT